MCSRKCLVTVVLTVACSWFGGPAVAQQRARMLFAEMDRDGDGVVTRSEWTGSAQAFRTHDWNGDGVLSGEEVRPVERYGRSAPGDTAATSGFNDWTAARFTQFDRNRDNRITRGEWRFDRDSFDRADDNGDGILSRQEFLRAGREAGTIGTSGLYDWSDTQFDDLDRNRDNRISRGEWQFDRDSFVQADYDGDGFLTRREFLGLEEASNNQPGSETRIRFDRLDRNNDGRVTLGEWNGTRTAFDLLDTNRDGWLNAVEFSRDLNAPRQNTAYQLGYQQGLTEGRAAGREERQRNQAWDLDGQRELESADSGYEPRFGSRADYQTGYRAGFRVGYPEGWNNAR
jgi:Ca2+-binding EF-hand superfamily protein